MLARVIISMGACLVYLRVYLSVRLSQTGTVSKRMHGSSWFSTQNLPSEIGVSPKIRIGYFLWNFIPNSGLRKLGHGTTTVAASATDKSTTDSRVVGLLLTTTADGERGH